MKYVMTSNRSSNMTNLLISAIFTTYLNIVFGNHEQVYRKCMGFMKHYCNSKNPEILDCARGGVLLYRINGLMPDYIKLYFNEIVFPNTSISAIELPLVFCHQTEVEFANRGYVDHFVDFVTGIHQYLPKGKRILDICLAHLKDFRDHLEEFKENSNFLRLAFFDKDVDSYHSQKYFAAFYLNYISWNVYIKEGRPLEPSDFCDLTATAQQTS